MNAVEALLVENSELNWKLRLTMRRLSFDVQLFGWSSPLTE